MLLKWIPKFVEEVTVGLVIMSDDSLNAETLYVTKDQLQVN